MAFMSVAFALTGTLTGAVALAAPIAPQDPDPPAWRWEAAYTVDAIGLMDGLQSRPVRLLDNFDLIVDGDLERQFGWRGARFHASLLANGGAEPNALGGTLQGFDNIEVEGQGVRLFEAWLEQDLADGRASLLAGLYDVNSEFYVTDASDQLLAPPFGIGTDLAATGVNGPSIFPSTGLAVRLRIGTRESAWLQAAAVNARASTLGDPDGVDTRFDDGLLYLAEAGWSGPVRLVVGGWTYSEPQDDIRDLAPGGEPRRRDARGGWLLAERTLVETEQRRLQAFIRLGVSDGDTTDFRGGWQAGLKADGVTPGRPDSTLSFGLHGVRLSDKARANLSDAGIDSATAESGLELTYADTFGPVTVQPDLQWIRNPGGDEDRDALLVVGLRVILAFGGGQD